MPPRSTKEIVPPFRVEAVRLRQRTRCIDRFLCDKLKAVPFEERTEVDFRPVRLAGE